MDVRATSGRVCTCLAHHEFICALTCAVACPLTLVKVTTLVVHKVLNMCDYVFVLLGTENSNFLQTIACSPSGSNIGIR